MTIQYQHVDPATVVDSVTNPDRSKSIDTQPIDITLDHDDHRKVFGDSIPPPPDLSKTPPPPSSDQIHLEPNPSNSLLSSQGSPAYADIYNPHLAQIDASRLKSTPVGNYHLLLPAALHDSGLLFNPELSLSRVHIRQDPIAPELLQDPEFLRPPTVQDFQLSKPHPQALFVAESLEWRVILDQSDLFTSPPPDQAVIDADHIFDACNLPSNTISIYETVPVTLLPTQQASPIHLLQKWSPLHPDSDPPILDEFNLHKCWITGKKLYSSPPDTISSIVDRRLLIEFKESRERDPAVGLTGLESFVRALRVLLRIIGNALHGELRAVPTTSATIVQKLGWDLTSKAILQTLGWSETQMPDDRQAVVPPDIFGDSPLSKRILLRLMRAWIELNVWMSYHREILRQTNPASTATEGVEQITRLSVESASESIVGMIGYTIDHDDPSYSLNLPRHTCEAFYLIGAAKQNRDELLKFAYLVNQEASPRRAAELFSCLDEIFVTQRSTSRIIQELIAYEKSQGKFSIRDLEKAYQKLHLSPEHLGSDLASESIPLDFIVDNYVARARAALLNSDAAEHASIKEALKIISISRGNPVQLTQALEQDVDMDVKRAYSLLEINADLDDATILAIFDLYVNDAPARRDLMRHALRAVAEDRNSNYLRHFLKTGEKGDAGGDGWQQAPSADVPAGINNIGNTCYLNSVLQYFFSVKEIRNRVLDASATLVTPEPELADELSNKLVRRVGGRHISPRELQRSKRFVVHLAKLFDQLIHTNELAVTPERELAYLALVSSRAEELEAEIGPLIGEGLTNNVALTEEPEEQQSSAVGSAAAAAVPSNQFESSALLESPPVPMDTSESSPAAASEAPTGASTTVFAPPPLPPRPARGATLSLPANSSADTDPNLAQGPHPARRNSLMQLGAQQDVSECLDNCMFQLEVALAMQQDGQATASSGPEISVKMDVDRETQSTLQSATTDEVDELDDDLLTDLFLGRTCQRIELISRATDVVEGSSMNGSRSTSAKQNSTHIKNEIFKILPIDVLEEGRDIYDGLDGFFDSETFVATSGDVQQRSVTLLSPPPLLQIQLQRVQYDRKTARAFKSQAHLQMDETIYVDRYVDLDLTKEEDMVRWEKRKSYQQKRTQIGELRARIAACKDDQGRQMTQVLSQSAGLVEELARLPSLDELTRELADIDATRSSGSERRASSDLATVSPRSKAKQLAANQNSAHVPEVSFDSKDREGGDGNASSSVLEASRPPALASLIDSGLSSMLRSESALLKAELSAAEEGIRALKAEMTSIWTGEERYAYHLVAVFMHRGEASHGHYFLNLRGLGGDKKWFKYNDSAVTPSSLDQVLRDSSGATPYLVTYVRQDHVDLIDPICRILDPLPGTLAEVEGASWSNVDVEHSSTTRAIAEAAAAAAASAANTASFPTPITTTTSSGDGLAGQLNSTEDATSNSIPNNDIESPIKRARTSDSPP